MTNKEAIKADYDEAERKYAEVNAKLMESPSSPKPEALIAERELRGAELKRAAAKLEGVSDGSLK